MMKQIIRWLHGPTPTPPVVVVYKPTCFICGVELSLRDGMLCPDCIHKDGYEPD